MRRGRPLKPTITIESVIAALKSLDFATQNNAETQPLENLLLVDFYLQNSMRPSAKNLRAWMLRKIISDFITNALNQHRQQFSLSSVTINSSRDTVLRQFSENFKQDSSYLQAWGLLYIRYVRPEFNFSMKELTMHSNVHVRSLQRFQDTGIRLLQDILIESEWEVRKSQQQSFLKSQMPATVTELVGREQEIERVFAYLDEPLLKPIVISGEAGIGKSALAAFITDQLIRLEAIDYILWITKAQSVAYVENKIWDTVVPYQSQQHWREMLDFQRLILVLDDVSNLDIESEGWGELLINLQSSFVLILNRDKPILPQAVKQIELAHLSQSDSCTLIANYHASKLEKIANLEQYVEITGNPQQLIHAIQLQSHHTNINLNTLAKTIYDMRFNKLSEQERVFHVLSTVETIDVTALEHVFALEDNVLNEKFPVSYVRDCYIADAELEAETLRLIEAMMIGDSERKLDTVLLSIAACEWLQLDQNIMRRMLATITVDNLSIGEIRQWRFIYLRRFGLDEQFDVQQLNLSYLYGVALRSCYESDEAEQHLHQLIEACGRQGNFNLQVQALYQLGLLQQGQGSFTNALDIYQHIEQLPMSEQISHIKRNIAIQSARIAVERHDAASALYHLQGMSLEKPEIFVLFCEAEYLRQNFDFIIKSIPPYLQHHQLNNMTRASLHTILGRTLQERGQIEKAIVHLGESLALTELEANYFDIARARSNLAACYLGLASDNATDTLDDIEDMLAQSQNLQAQIKDYVGLEASQANLKLLKHLRRKSS